MNINASGCNMKMTAKDYKIAYKFLKIRATEPGSFAPFRVTDNLPAEQKERIFKFIRTVHLVKII